MSIKIRTIQIAKIASGLNHKVQGACDTESHETSKITEMLTINCDVSNCFNEVSGSIARPYKCATVLQTAVRDWAAPFEIFFSFRPIMNHFYVLRAVLAFVTRVM